VADTLEDIVKGDMEILSRMFQRILTYAGFDEEHRAGLDFSRCHITQEQDHLSGDTLVTGFWLGKDGVQFGHFIRQANGILFAECDVLQNHPLNPAMYIEAMEVWGTSDKLKYDLRLLPALS